MKKGIRGREVMNVYTFRCTPSLIKKFDKYHLADYCKSRSDAIYNLIKDYVSKREEETEQKQAG